MLPRMPANGPTPDTIVLVHGLWVTPRSWEHWIPHFEARGYRVLAATAAEFERDVPFGVWEEALDGYGSSDRWGAVPRWDRDMSGEPALAEEGGGVATLPDERYRTHRAVRALLERIAADVPLVVVLDDVHWFDDASVEVLVSLLHRPPRARVLIALGYRSGRAPAALAPALAARSEERRVGKEC